ncbi:hypothetical protein PACTADRAFT_2700 [Pachysolen tannophilus NRRL Y-2460]|uniref:Mitochondrial 15S rRNA processing factor CCM1 n=1 Tax=Pachysolen tannophilus NRRL Y-2460 TaxID=669874 RepID=A0A1E4TXD6_PACTA|nr:hypothetical protein PACTADRAFT_2700 [Pachysolen tannophilus NRRL Y-2460]
MSLKTVFSKVVKSCSVLDISNKVPVPRSNIGLKIGDDGRHEYFTENQLQHPNNGNKNNGKEIKDYLMFIGKGSRFGTRYTRPLVDKGKKLKIEQDLIDQNHAYFEKIKTTNKFYESNKLLVDQILSKLILLTPPYPDYSISDFKKILHPRRMSILEIPPIPKILNHDSFHKYIDDLTSFYYYKKRSSSKNGLISRILVQLFHPHNKIIKNFRTISSYNNVIKFFCDFNDIDYSRNLFKQMEEIDQINPNTSTFNILINQLNNSLKHNTNPLITTLRYLKMMETKKIPVDLCTWHIIYKIFKDDTSKSLLLDKYSYDLNLPVTNYLTHYVIEDLSQNLTAEEIITYIKDNNISCYDINTINTIALKFLKENKFKQAWFYLKDEYDYASQHDIKGRKPSLSTLNCFLEYFCQREMIVKALSVYNGMKTFYQVTPNLHTFNLLIATSVKMGFHDNWRTILRIINNEMITKNQSIVNKSSYWLTRARSRALVDHKNDCKRLDLKKNLNEKELMIASNIKKKLCWTLEENDFIEHPYYDTQDKEYRKLCYIVGSRLPKGKLLEPEEFNVLDKSYIKNSDEDKLKMEHFKKILKIKNINKTYAKRVSIVKNGLVNSLVEEMAERQLGPSPIKTFGEKHSTTSAAANEKVNPNIELIITGTSNDVPKT